MKSHLRHAKRHGSFATVVVLTLFVVAAIGGGYYYYSLNQTKDITGDLITTPVVRDRFQHIVLEQGEVESSNNVEVVCNVEGRNSQGTSILWVIDEGTRVKKGEKLVELDSSALEQEIKQQRIVVNSSRAMKISAESALEQAKVAREEYLEGQFKQEEKQIESEILVAEENLSRAQETAYFSEELAAQGFETLTTLRADKFAVQKSQVELDLAQNKLKTLRQITQRKMLIGFDADIETAKAKFEAEVSSHQEELDKLAELQEQLAYCVILAPEDGQVVHANRFSSRGGSAEFVVEAGAMVRERQTIIRLPDPDLMQVKAKINESKISLVGVDMPVRVQIGAFEENVLDGMVTKVNKYAEPTSYWSSQVKEYATLIKIIDPPPEVRTGMTAEVQILVEQRDDALQIPVQALVNYRAHYFCVVLNGQTAETREIKIGPTDDKVVVIESGLKEKEVVVMNPKNHDGLLDLPDLPEPDEAKPKSGRSSKGPPAGRVARGGPPAGGRPGGGGPPAGVRPGGRPGGGGPPAGVRGGGGPPAGVRPGGGGPPAGVRPGGGGPPNGVKPQGGRPSGVSDAATSPQSGQLANDESASETTATEDTKVARGNDDKATRGGASSSGASE